jgi:hypothetical protein
MRRLTIALLTACLLGTSAIPAMAQSTSPEPPPWFGGRVEMPEHGFAVTLPDDWVAFDTTMGVASQIETAGEVLDAARGSAQEALLVPTLAELAANGYQLWASHPTSDENCSIGAWSRDALGISGTRDELADRLYELFAGDPIYREVEPPQRLDLPIGPAFVVRMTERRDPSVDQWWPTSVFAIATDERVLVTLCTSSGALPRDDWLSIVETIELLPWAHGPVVIGGRIEVPNAGFAIDVPHGWLAADLSHPDVVPELASMGEAGSGLADAMEGHLGASFDDRLALGHHMALWTSPADEGPENRQHCEAYVLKTVLTSIGQFVELYSSHSKDDPTQTWEQVDLPGGSAARNDYQWSPTSFGSDYTFFDGRRFVTLSCVQGIPVEGVDEAARRDAWLSIAETFEFLPAEE